MDGCGCIHRFLIDFRGLEEDWRRLGGGMGEGLEDWRRVGGGMEEDWRRVGGSLEDASIDFR